MTPLKITKRYLGKTFEQCNCMELIRRIYGDLGVRLPESHKGIKTSDIPALLHDRPKFAQAMLVSACNAIGKRIGIDQIKRYDLVLVHQKISKVLFPGVYLGSSKIITSATRDGVTAAKLSDINKPIAAWRIV